MKLFYTSADCQKPAVQSEAYFWNMAGSMFSAMISIVFSVVVARVCLSEISDAYAVAYALSSQLWTVANFESNTLQVTDTNNKFSSSNYYSFKLILFFVSIFSTLVIVGRNLIFGQYDPYKASIIFTFCLFRIIEGFSNYYYAVFQKHEHLNIAGYSVFVRTGLSMIVFSAVLLLTKDLLTAIISICITVTAWVYFYDAKLSVSFARPRFALQTKPLFGIFVQCLPLFLSSFLITYVINLPKYTIDQLMPDNAGIQTAFSAIFQPAAVINLFCLFIFRPTLTKLSNYYNKGNHKNYLLTAMKTALFALGFTVVALIAAWLLGIPVLRFVYGERYILDEYVVPLLFVILGGSFYAFSQLLYNMITIIRCQYFMLLGYVVVIPATYLVAKHFVSHYGIIGAAGLYMLSMIGLFLVLLIIFIACYLVVKNRPHPVQTESESM